MSSTPLSSYRDALKRQRLVVALLTPIIVLCATRTSTSQVILSTCLSQPTALTKPSYRQLATEVAPVLWFSPDEPLLGPKRSLAAHPLPEPLPTPANPSEAPPVDAVGRLYFRVAHIRARTGTLAETLRRAQRPSPGSVDDTVPLEALESIRISYFAYYSRDVGFGEHAHDFETVELSLVVEREETTGNCYNVSLFRASGAAHGSDWFSNTLVLRDRRKRQSSDILDVVLPLHVLVEEGKHASAPDRNADGVYSPGYDSTENVVDAWGIRDALRNNMQGGADYQAEHAKVRTRLPLRAVPERYRGAWLAEAAILPREGLESLEPSGGERVPYVLEASGDSAARSWCEAIRASSADGGVSLDKTNARNTSNLRHFMAYWDFCKETEVAGPRPRVWGESGWPGPHGPASGTSRDRLGLTVAMAGGHGHEWSSTVVVSGGIGVIPPVVRGWLVPRIRLHDVVPSTRDACRDPGKPEPSASACGSSRSVAGEIAYMKSGSRLFDWYVAYAPSWSMNRSRDQQEIGIKFRAPWSKTSPLNSMVTAYFGYRGSLLKDVASGRWVVGAGIGGW